MTGQELEALRKAGKVSREELATALGVSYARIQRTEEARDTPLQDTFALLCVASLEAITRRRHEEVSAARPTPTPDAEMAGVSG